MKQFAVDLRGAAAGMIRLRLLQFRRIIPFLGFEVGDFLLQGRDALPHFLPLPRTRLPLLGLEAFLFPAVNGRNV